MTGMAKILNNPAFPRSNKYDPQWVMDNQMGPNALWLMEWLARDLPLEPGCRILDLGCGRAMTSIFLAREFKARVWAADLWISPENNYKRVVESGVDDLVFPIRAEAHALPFAQGFFDGVVSVDAYQYFGTDVLYLSYLSRFVRPGGFVGIVVPGLTREMDTIPRHLAEPQPSGKIFWEDACRSFKTAEWWMRHWVDDPSVTEVRTDVLKDGWRHWRDFEAALELSGKNIFPSDAHALDQDQGQYIGFIRARAQRTWVESFNLYDSSTGIQVGID
ncbi:SAM-dependent methyltransferase [Desulfonatronovibrio hydrogenovorans]|uniref:SAM-dependent methyltransferase n=1 Tax=Desulfonatronovibrio hydrogenovorans TaxID=53245 RepID=UPI000A025B5C|nr:methyltransferase domain-containing protein [Desulfonatronovibrio hydrogenovorans]